jgi:hypothetical protein
MTPPPTPTSSPASDSRSSGSTKSPAPRCVRHLSRPQLRCTSLSPFLPHSTLLSLWICQYLLDMLRGGGTDAGDWEGDCTHVIVYGLLYVSTSASATAPVGFCSDSPTHTPSFRCWMMQDDPLCVAARELGNKVVTEEWVDDSIDLGVLADADRVSLPTHPQLPASYSHEISRVLPPWH